MARGIPAFTPVDDDLIRQLYPTGGADACLSVMPGRRRGAIRHRAHKLGVRSPLGEQMKARMRGRPEGNYPWPPLDQMTLALQNFGFITRTGQLRPIVTVELEAV